MQVEKHVLIASNPKSGASLRAGLVSDLHQGLSSAGFTTEVITDLDELKSRAIRYHREGTLQFVVAAGGDGTVAVLANLLPDEIEILIFPLGTENLLSKHYGLKADVRQAIETVKSGGAETIDVGLANGQIFLVMLSIGFDAEVVREMSRTRTGHINRLSYFGPIGRAMWRYRFPKLPIRVGGEHVSDRQISPAWMFVFNVPRYAAGLDFCPQADPLDGQLDLCTFESPGVLNGLGYLSRLAMGTHQSMAGFTHQRCTELELAAAIDHRGDPVADVPYQIDGDHGGTLPLKVTVGPGRLRLRIPKTA